MHTEQAPPQEQGMVRRAIWAAAIGNFITWFDFAAYGFLAVILGGVFFPSANPLTSLLATFGAFGVAFLMNPIGGLVFGQLGDKLGRKRVLATVITIMSLSTFAVGLLPGYATIGLAAPVLLILLRIIQGFAAGGEPGGAATFLVETARRGRRARVVSFWHASSYLANAAACTLILGLNAIFSNEFMAEWGWRLPFLIAGPLGMIGLYIRLRLSDTEEFERMQAEGEISKNPAVEAFRTSWRQILQTAGIIALQAAAFYFIFVYMETYIQSQLGLTAIQASISTVTCLCIAGISIFAFARVSDHVGRKPILMASAGSLVAVSYPVFLVMNGGGFVSILMMHTLLGVCLAMFMAASGAGMVEIFPSNVRYTGFSIGFNVSVALFGGTAPFVATALIQGTGSPLSPAWIVIVTGAIALVTAMTLRETAGTRVDAITEAAANAAPAPFSTSIAPARNI